MLRRTLVALACAAVALAGCGDGGDEPQASLVDVLGDDDTLDGDPAPDADDDADDAEVDDDPAGTADDDPQDADAGGEVDGDADGDDDGGGDDGDDSGDGGERAELAIDEPVEDDDLIDAAYVERVVTAIDAVLAALVADVQDNGGWTDSAQVAIEALYVDGAQDTNAEAWQEIVDLGFVEQDPDPDEARVVDLVSVSTACIAVHVDRLGGSFFAEDSPFPTEPTFLLGLRQDPTLVGGANPTVWAIESEGVVAEEDVFDVCESRSTDAPG